MRAAHPDLEGTVDQNGIGLYYEVYGEGEPTILLIPTWCIFHSRFWKMQIPYLARHYRVVTWDARGNGKSGQPRGSEAFSWQKHMDDLLAVMDATHTKRAVMVGVSMSGYWANLAAILYPHRVHATIAIGPATGLGIALPERSEHSYTEELDTTEGWAKENVHFIRSNYQEYIEFFVSQLFRESHSTKPIEDGVGWAEETDAETLIASDLAELLPQEDMAAFWSQMDRPALVIQGSEDGIISPDSSRELARLTGASLMELVGSGHVPNVRNPVKVNLAIKDFVDRLGVGVSR